MSNADGADFCHGWAPMHSDKPDKKMCLRAFPFQRVGYAAQRGRESVLLFHSKPDRSATNLVIAVSSFGVVPSLSKLNVMLRPLRSVIEYQGPFSLRESLRSPSGMVSSDATSWNE